MSQDSEAKSLCSALEKYYSGRITISEKETKLAKEKVLPTVRKVLDYVHEKDPMFMVQTVATGSSYQGLKTSHPDEFDFSVQLDVSTNFVRGGKARFYAFNKDVDDPISTARRDLEIIKKTVPLPTPPAGEKALKYDVSRPATGTAGAAAAATSGGRMPSADVMFDGNLIPFSVKSKLKNLATEAVQKLTFEGGVKVEVSQKISGPATTLKITPRGKLEISVDLSPIICTDENTQKSGLHWPRSGTHWPTKDKKEEFLQIGVNYVAKKNFNWTLDTVCIEKKIFEGIDKGGSCRKKSQRILKKLKEDMFCPKQIKILSSYCLKNALLWECEEYPNNTEWTNEKLGERVVSMAGKLARWLRDRKVPWYFHKEIDILRLDSARQQDADMLVANTERFIRNPRAEVERLLAKL